MILWYYGNELILGELEKGENSIKLNVIHKLSLPIHSSPLVVKSAASREILLNALKALMAQVGTHFKTLEVWLTPDWGYRDVIPTPEVPMEEFVSHIRWEIEQRVNDLLDRYLLYQKQIPNVGIAFAVIRPSVVKFWRQLLFEFDCRLSSLRIADPENLNDTMLFDFATRAQGVAPPKAAVTKESGMSYHFSKKSIPVWVWLIVGFLVILGFLFLWKPWQSTTRHSKPRVIATTQEKQAVPPTIQDTTVQSTQNVMAPAKQLAELLKQMQNIAVIEGATIVPGLISIQLISKEDKTQQIEPIISQLKVNADIRFSEQTNRLLVLIPIEDYTPSPNFTIKSDQLKTAENAIEGETNAVIQWIETLNELPYRMVYLREKEGARVVVFR